MNPNTLGIVDLTSATVIANIPIGNDPHPLALSDDDSTLWVGLTGDYAIRKVTLGAGAPTLGPLQTVPSPAINGMTFGAWALEMAVFPGSQTTIAATVRSLSTWVTVFDDGVARPANGSSVNGVSRIAIGPTPYVFGYDSIDSGFALSVYSVSSAGATFLSANSQLVGGFEGFLLYDRNRLFSFYGEVIDVSTPATPIRAGVFDFAGAIAVRDAGHVFMLSPSFLLPTNDQQQLLRLLDTTTFTQVASVALPTNMIPATSMFTDLVYIGGDELVFLAEDFDNSHVVYIAHVPSLVAP